MPHSAASTYNKLGKDPHGKKQTWHIPYAIPYGPCQFFFWGGALSLLTITFIPEKKLTTSWLNPDNIKEYHFDAGEEKKQQHSIAASIISDRFYLNEVKQQ